MNKNICRGTGGSHAWHGIRLIGKKITEACHNCDARQIYVCIPKPVMFKTHPDYFEKERDGRKPNTVRFLKDEDPRLGRLLMGADKICIVNKDTGRQFVRDITDFTEFKTLKIISWRHA